MVTQRKVLTFMAQQTAERHAVTTQNLAREFGLSPDAAGAHLRRLWRERLIATPSDRPPRFRFRLQGGEPIHSLRFGLTARGRERLRWYERQDHQDGGGLFE